MLVLCKQQAKSIDEPEPKRLKATPENSESAHNFHAESAKILFSRLPKDIL